MTALRYDPLLVVERESDALRDAAARDLSARVPSCPDWDSAALVEHLGLVQLFHAAHVVRGVTDRPDDVPRPVPPERAELLSWSARATASLLDALRAVGDDAPAWTWAAHVPQLSAFWPRRMALEALVHRWDAQSALGEPLPLEAVVAEDAVDEVLAVHGPADRAEEPAPAGVRGTALVRCTDTGAAWVVEVDGSRFVTRREAEEAEPRRGGAVARSDRPEDAAVEGTASQLALALWGRGDLAALVTGDAELAAALAVAD